MRAWALAILMVTTALVGCLGGADEEIDPTSDTDASTQAQGPELLCHPGPAGALCNFEMTPDDEREGNEVTIAVNPTDPMNIVGGAKDYYPPDAGECVWDGVYVTHDGGASYDDRSFEGSPWRAEDGDPSDFEPNYASQFWCTTDPVAYFDVNGRLYYLLMAYQADRVTGSKTCEEECPNGALNDWAFNRATQIVAISDDGGDTFHTFTPVLEGTFPVNFHDKGWLAASPDGTIHVMWLAFFVPGNQYCRSIDEGQSYQCTEVIAPQFAGAGQGSFLEVGTGDQVYALWTANGGVQLKRSFDTGATWDEQRQIFDVNGEAMPGLSPRDRRGGFPMLATDRNPDSPLADSLYVVWQDACNEATWSSECDTPGTGIYLSASHDEGESWTEPVRLSDDREIWRIFPAVSVSPGGVVDVSWMESGTANRTTAGEPHDSLEQAYTFSTDGGAMFSDVYQVRDVDDGGWDPADCHHQNGMIFIGDYNDIDSSWQAAHPVWPDARQGVCDVYTATIQRPLFTDGWSEEDQTRILEELEERPLADGETTSRALAVVG